MIKTVLFNTALIYLLNCGIGTAWAQSNAGLLATNENNIKTELFINNIKPQFAKDHYISTKDVITVVFPDNAPLEAGISLQRHQPQSSPIASPAAPVLKLPAKKNAEGKKIVTFSLENCNCWDAARPGEYVFVYIEGIPNIDARDRRFVLTINPENNK